ncbi:MAG: hypothetical protein A4E28_02058 [Methanocella sp. PtaU1.Bin125]|nr:MAG: hypothetical protein A4E28_02058 [Methanocella sp. PtaU1.Bin125]
MNCKKTSILTICLIIVTTIALSGCICGNTSVTPTPTPTPAATPITTSTVTPSPTPGPAMSAELSGWRTDKDTYARGENATGWVYVYNTGDGTIERMDFTLVIHRSVFLIGDYSITYNYNLTGLDIKPGGKEKVQFVQQIPSEYSGISTAGDYRFDVTAFLAGHIAGEYSKNIRVV